MKNNYAPRDPLLSLGDVSQWTQLSGATIYRYIGKGTFPRPIRTAANGARRWPESVIHQWIKARMNDNEPNQQTTLEQTV